MPDVATTTKPRCPCCGQIHRLARCFYVFPELAPEDFKEREHIRAKVKEALLDPKLLKEVESLRRRRGSN
ncbi:hypothetical protein QBC38DRAFT_494454 [Podospora fimiseda]|uniref:Uncharacterized protein n=1 Tax=Podospora fimiseda TaxID=252190 RepID=A0AAN6YJU4_9PEZI|nr:hypothetical protein QBC38DRAFT_494454 [Podospora fimiseda]